jgi:hypothetical protein
LWGIATALAELVVWPGERRIQSAVTGSWQLRDRALDRECRRVSATAGLLATVFVAAAVLMFVKP